VCARGRRGREERGGEEKRGEGKKVKKREREKGVFLTSPVTVVNGGGDFKTALGWPGEIYCVYYTVLFHGGGLCVLSAQVNAFGNPDNDKMFFWLGFTLEQKNTQRKKKKMHNNKKKVYLFWV
jgi:hypothetical protein